MFKKLTYGFLMLMLPFIGWGDVLRWAVNDFATVDGSPIADFISPLPDDEDNWAVCRLRMTTAGGEVRYLDFTDPGGDINSIGTTYNGSEGMWIDGGGEFFGAEMMQSVLPSDASSTSSFLIELGMNHYNANTDSIDFELLAISDEEMYDNLLTFIYRQHDINPPTTDHWTPLYYHTTPEPSSALLVLIGVGFLSLKRRKTC